MREYAEARAPAHAAEPEYNMGRPNPNPNPSPNHNPNQVLCSFTWVDARLAVAAGGTGTGVATLLVPGELRIEYAAWLRCLALCGMLKYSNAPMSAAQKARSLQPRPPESQAWP